MAGRFDFHFGNAGYIPVEDTKEFSFRCFSTVPLTYLVQSQVSEWQPERLPYSSRSDNGNAAVKSTVGRAPRLPMAVSNISWGTRKGERSASDQTKVCTAHQ